MKATKQKAARSPRVMGETRLDVKIDRLLLPTKPSRLMDSNGISFDRLEEIEIEIARGVPIDGELRNEIRQLIGYVLDMQDAKHGRGAPTDEALGTLAKIVGALNELYAIPIAEAARAMVRDGDGEDEFNRAKAIERAYRRQKKTGEHFLVSEQLVQQALERIRARRNKSGA